METKTPPKEKKPRTKYDQFTISLLRWGSIGLAIFAVIVGIISLFWDNILGEEPDKAVIWFGLAVVAILVPFIREITIKDIHLVLKDLEEAKNKLEATALTSQLLQDRLTATRAELIKGYQKYIDDLDEPEKTRKIVEMSRLYINEMGLDIDKIKAWFAKLGYQTKSDQNISQQYISIIKAFQVKHNLDPDGIFGYQTYHKLLSEIESKQKTSDS